MRNLILLPTIFALIACAHVEQPIQEVVPAPKAPLEPLKMRPLFYSAPHCISIMTSAHAVEAEMAVNVACHDLESDSKSESDELRWCEARDRMQDERDAKCQAIAEQRSAAAAQKVIDEERKIIDGEMGLDAKR